MRTGDRYIEVTIDFQKTDGMWAAECRELGTASCGHDFEEAEARIIDAIELQLNTLEETGERARFFKERGIRIKTSQAKKPRPVQVPVHLDGVTTRTRVSVPA